jgi:hypothetical protein
MSYAGLQHFNRLNRERQRKMSGKKFSNRRREKWPDKDDIGNIADKGEAKEFSDRAAEATTELPAVLDG